MNAPKGTLASWLVMSQDRKLVVAYVAQTNSNSQDDANARLIAAAPEMLKALRYFAHLGIETCSRCGGDGKASQVNEACAQCGGTGKDTHNPDPGEIERARALLARLEGEK